MANQPGAVGPYLVQDVGAEPDLCQLVVEGISRGAWKPSRAEVKGETKAGKGPARPHPQHSGTCSRL